MKISEQALAATHQVTYSGHISEMAVIIQRAIDDHEKDLVAAAERLVRQSEKFGCVPLECFDTVKELKAALNRRKE